MSANTRIEWTDHTFNPWEGCQKVGPGCDNCYAESRNARFAGGQAVNWGPDAPRRRTSASNWAKPKAWNARGAAFFTQHGRRQRVFCASLADVFDNAVDPSWRADLFALILRTPNLDWLLLTKRIGNVKRMLGELAHGRDPDLSLLDMMPLPNVWLGATIVNQDEADRDIPKLLAAPAARRFLSMEPLLGPVDLTRIEVLGGDAEIYPLKGTTECVNDEGEPTDDVPALDWVIVGGESGHGARPMNPEWVRSLRDQCQAAGAPFLFKQWGEWLPGQNDEYPHARQRVAHHQNGTWGATHTKVNSSNYVVWDEVGTMHRGSLTGAPAGFRVNTWAERVGKKAAGRQLDGHTWDEVPV